MQAGVVAALAAAAVGELPAVGRAQACVAAEEIVDAHARAVQIVLGLTGQSLAAPQICIVLEDVELKLAGGPFAAEFQCERRKPQLVTHERAVVLVDFALFVTSKRIRAAAG